MKLIQRGYDPGALEEQIDKARQKSRNSLLIPKPGELTAKTVLAVTYNKKLPNLKKVIDDNWNILSINPEIAPLFKDKPILAYRRNRNLQNILCKHKLENNLPISRKHRRIGKCRPCWGRRNNKCCKQMVTTNHFTNRKTGKVFNILHNLNCKSFNVIYLIECILCNNKPYVGKTETQSNVRTNGHRSEAKKPDSIAIDRHFFENEDHDFEKHAKITLIEKLENTSHMTESEITTNLEKREDFWMKKLNSLTPDGFNQELNFPHL